MNREFKGTAENKEFRDIIDSIQDKYNIKKKDIAEKIGVTQSYLSRIITGMQPYNESLKEKIYETFPDCIPQKEKTVNQEFKDIIAEIKYKYGINQSEIADRLGITRAYLSEVISGRAPFNATLRQKVNVIFQLDKRLDKKIEDSILSFMRENGLTVYDIAEKLGLPVTNVTETLAAGFDGDTARLWSDVFGFNVPFLLNGDGELIRRDYHSVPLLPVSAHAGHLSEFAAQVSKYECEMIVSPIRDAELAIPIIGESMYPELPSGSVVFVKKINERAFIEWGKPYVLDTSNGAVVKYLAPGTDESCVRCVSANPNPMYAPFEIPLSEIYGIYRIVNMLCNK